MSGHGGMDADAFQHLSPSIRVEVVAAPRLSVSRQVQRALAGRLGRYGVVQAGWLTVLCLLWSFELDFANGYSR
jgi:hypothetical protein